MRKILNIITAFFIILTLFITPVINAQDIGKMFKGSNIPGLDCGVGGAKDGTEKCCDVDLNQSMKIPTAQLPGIVDLIIKGFSNFPVIGASLPFLQNVITEINKRYDTLEKFQQNKPGAVCVYGAPDPAPGAANCVCTAKDPAKMVRPIAELCYKYLGSSKEMGSCMSCAANNSIWTALGCIPLNLQAFVSQYLLSTGIGLGGIVALLCIIYSAFMMQTSRGNPEKIKKAQEMLTSCIMGLMLIIFSVFILRLIGVDILKIPGLTGK